MDILHFILILLCIAPFAVSLSVNNSQPSTTMNVLDFGAVGDGKTNDTQAFAQAWEAMCSSNTAYPMMVIPEDRTFLLYPLKFEGPCKATQRAIVMIEGSIIAPDSTSTWSQIDQSLWFGFFSVNGLLIDGNGTIDGRGYNWWNQSCKHDPKQGCTEFAPTAMKLVGCTDVVLRNIYFRNGQQCHLLILSSERVYIWNLNIKAPETSPNTDGIHIQNTSHAMIQNSVIGTGDDCVSIGDKIFDVEVDRISCGPGHGISVGSLGRDGGQPVSVEQVHIKRSHFYASTNGARIKTWQGGSGYARNISFENLNFYDVYNPIIIDQYYCDSPHKCDPQKNAVQISDVTYINLWGTSKNLNAINLNCSQSVACQGIHFRQINLTASNPNEQTFSICINANGDTNGYIHPATPCLKP